MSDKYTPEMTRREWLVGGTMLATGLMVSGIAKAQVFPDPISNPTMENPIRVGSNENVYGPSLKAQAAMEKAKAKAHLYNFWENRDLKQLIAKMENIPADHIGISTGSSPFLEKAGYIARFDNGAVLCPDPTYGSLPMMASRVGAKVIRVPVGDDMAISLDAMRAAMTDEVKVVYLCNPNNPIPTIIEKNALREFCLEMSKRALVIIDEAYYEYVDDPIYATMADLVVENQNIVVCRTASKIHAFAGIRVGFAFAHPETLKLLTPPFNLSVSYAGIMGAMASYQDTEYQDFVRAKNKESMQILYDVFDELGLEYIKSHTNFTFFNAGMPATELTKALEAYGVRGSRPFPPFMNWSRMSTVKPEEMRHVAKALKEILGS